MTPLYMDHHDHREVVTSATSSITTTTTANETPLLEDSTDDNDTLSDPMHQRKRWIRQTWHAVEHGLDVHATEAFYQRLFVRYPETRDMFRECNMQLQAQKLYEVLRVAVRFLDQFDALVPTLQELGERHAQHYGVIREHYHATTIVFIEVLTTYILYSQWPAGLADLWRDEVADAWTWLLDLIGTTMADAADEAIQKKPRNTEECNCLDGT
jgi:hemoglobin-like flavoprotein